MRGRKVFTRYLIVDAGPKHLKRLKSPTVCRAIPGTISLLWERPMPLDTSLYPLLRDLFFYWQLSCSESQPPSENDKLYKRKRQLFEALSIQPKVPEISVGTSNATDHFGLARPVWSFRSVGKCPFPFDKIVVPSTALLYPAYKNNNQTRGGLGRVCETEMYRSIGHVKFPKFQTGIFVEWKAPLIYG